MRTMQFSVYDKAVDAFMPLFPARSKNEAIRSFKAAAGDSKHEFCKNPEDYVLCFIGEFDDHSGSLVCPASGPEKIYTALDAVRENNALSGS